MGANGLKQRIERYERENREAAEMITADPERYPGIMQEWAARTIAYQLAFHSSNPWRDGLSEEDRNELADLMAWRRR